MHRKTEEGECEGGKRRRRKKSRRTAGAGGGGKEGGKEGWRANPKEGNLT